MKLDENVLEKIRLMAVECVWSDDDGAYLDDYFVEMLKKLDLVVKPGDSSQSVLVENK